MMRLKSGTEHLNYGREIIQNWGADLYSQKAQSLQSVQTHENDAGVAGKKRTRSGNHPQSSFRVLDIGSGPGTDLHNVRLEIENRQLADARLPLELWGIESYKPNIDKCKQLGIRTAQCDIEKDDFPGKEGQYDLLIANQVLEHTKEIFWIMAEAGRLLRPGGHFIVGVPNIASLHNRLLLMLGQQPTQIQSMSAHVRGFTKPDFRQFATTGELFRLIRFRGSNFYPLPPVLSRPLARIFPTLAWGSFYLLERTGREGTFLECLWGDADFLETPFFGGPQNPTRSGWHKQWLKQIANKS